MARMCEPDSLVNYILGTLFNHREIKLLLMRLSKAINSYDVLN